MYRFIRTVTFKTGADQAASLKFAGEVTAYLNKTYARDIKYGTELFRLGKIHWHLDADSLDELTALNAKMMQDREYQGLLDKAKAFWVEGAMEDTVVFIAG